MENSLSAGEGFELHRRHSTTISNETEPRQEFFLPPTDSGKDAWLILAGAFIAECLTWSLPYTFGIFEEYYSHHTVFQSEAKHVSLIGVTMFSIMLFGSPLCLLTLRRWQQYRRHSIVVGVILSASALLAASFASRVWQLVLTQGLLYGVGGSFMYYPFLLLVDEWFVHRKGMAFGIAWSGTAFSGLLMPFLMSWSLSQYSFRTTLRWWAVAIVAFMIPLLHFSKPRVRPSATSRLPRPVLKFSLKNPFLVFQIANVIQSLGFYLPGIYLPSYTRSIGLSSAVATASVSLLNAGQFIGSILVGFVIDRWHVTSVILLCSLGATVAVMLIWGWANSAPTVCIFAAVYGIFGGSFVTTWPGVVREAQGRDMTVESGLAYSLLVAGRGVGSVLSGPLSQALLGTSLGEGHKYGYMGGYMPLIVFTGITSLLGAGPFVARLLGRI